MAPISYDYLWRSELHNSVSAKDKFQDMNLNQLEVEGNDIFKKDEKITTSFEPSNDENVLNRTYLDTKLSNIGCHILFIQKSYNEFAYLERSNKQSGEFLIESAVKSTLQILYDKGSFENCHNAVEVLKDYLFLIEVDQI